MLGVGNRVLGKCSSHQALPLSRNLTSSHILLRVSQFSLLGCSHCTCSVSRCPCLSVSDLDPVPSGLPLPPSCSLRQNSQPLCASVSPRRKWGKEQENKGLWGSKTKPETWRLFFPVFCHCVCYSGPALSSSPTHPAPALPSGPLTVLRSWGPGYQKSFPGVALLGFRIPEELGVDGPRRPGLGRLRGGVLPRPPPPLH